MSNIVSDATPQDPVKPTIEAVVPNDLTLQLSVGNGNGMPYKIHFSRNVDLSLAAAELVRPAPLRAERSSCGSL